MKENNSMLLDSTCENNATFSLNEKSLVFNEISPIPKLKKIHFLSDLLPYTLKSRRKKILHTALEQYLFLLNVAEQSITSLKNSNFKNFDALVGENACQIRALKLALILSEYSTDESFVLNKIISSKKKIEHLICDSLGLSQTDMSLKCILKKENAHVELNCNEMFLVKSYLLTKVKSSKSSEEEGSLLDNDYTDMKKTKEIKDNVSRTFVEQLISNLRKRMAENSVQFVMKLSEEMEYNPALNTKIISENFSTYHNGLLCIPCYWTTRILMLKTLRSKIPIVFLLEQKAKDQNYAVVRKTSLFFQTTPEGCKEVDSLELHPDQPSIVFRASSCRNFLDLPSLDEWKKDLLEDCPVELILACVAIHRQYPDSSKEYLVNEMQDEYYKYHLQKAKEWGCCSDNPSRFFLTHVFCDKIGNIEIS